MSSFNDNDKFLQAVFGTDWPARALLAVHSPKSDQWLTLRGYNSQNIRDDDDAYWCIAAFPADDSAVRTLARAEEVRALVIDDVGTKVDAGMVELALGEPTAIVETSSGNFQWAYRLAVPVPAAAWGGFFAEVERLVGVKLEGRDAVHLFRLPYGVNNKPGRGGFKVWLIQLNSKIELSGIDPGVCAPEPAPHSPATGTLGREALEALMALIPNDESITRDVWVNTVGHGLKGLSRDDAEGFEVFDAWSQTWTGGTYDAAATLKAWRSFGASSGLLSRGGKLKGMARAVAPEKYTRWEARAVFDDGVELPPEPEHPASAPASPPQVLSFDEFVEGFVPPNYLVEKLITRSFLYSLTGQTGAGKTSIALRLAATLALGRKFGGLETEQCRVLYLAAENPVDIQMRVIALATEMGFEGSSIPVFFVRGRFSIKAGLKALRKEALRVGGDFGLVVVDTGPVFFEGEDANDRVAMLNFARQMRDLIEGIPGLPAIIVNMHPVKNADASNLVPSGGGSFLNEIDGNLTAAKSEDQTIELHWQGKWRGVEFAPLNFLLKTVTHPKLVDSKGRSMPTVVCEHLSTDAKETMEQEMFIDEGKMLAEMMRKPRVSYADLAVHMGWYFFDGKPDKSKVQRYVKSLTKQKLVKKHLQLWEVAAMQKAKMNGSGGCAVSTVSTDTIRGDTVATDKY